MSCCSPLIGLMYDNRSDGKKSLKVMSFEKGKDIPDTDERKKVLLPCGHCIECRKEKSREWSNRLLMESKYHEDAYFITLTLCPEYAIIVPSYNPDTGEYRDRETLYKKDLQDFFKRLRKEFKNDKFRYFAVGEYGPKTGKSHYHMILFVDWHKDENGNKVVGFDDLKLAGVSECGQPRYDSAKLESLWTLSDARSERFGFPHGRNESAKDSGKDPDLLGWCELSIANHSTMKYVAGYIQKKLGANPNDLYYMMNLVPPFSISSRKPGIGYQYFEDNPDVMKADKIYLSTPQGVVECMPPRYFRKKLSEFNRALYDEIGEKHMLAAKDRFDAVLSRTDLDEQGYRKVVERNSLQRRSMRDKI